jgi:hypothetical protein
VRLYLSRAHEILCCGHELLSRDHEIIKWCARDTMSGNELLGRGHEIIKWCARDTMLWPQVTRSCAQAIIKWCAQETLSWPRVTMWCARDNEAMGARKLTNQITLYIFDFLTYKFLMQH